MNCNRRGAKVFMSAVALLGFFGGALSVRAQNASLKLDVDATQVFRRTLHMKMTIAVAPGQMTLVYPKWIPGEHGPVGPINDLAGLKFTVAGNAIRWHRDDVDMYAFHLDPPAGAKEIEAEFYLTGTTDEIGYLLGDSSAPDQMMLDWDQVVLYPLGAPTDAQTIQATLTLPPKWKFATALETQSQNGQQITFKPVSLTTLVDSPLLSGTGLREFDISPPGEPRAHKLDIAAQSASAVDIPEAVIASYRRLVTETGALFQARHYYHYNFLVWLHGTYEDGLEHHQSSDNRLPEMGMADPEWRLIEGDLLSHEMTHSWNGKYRRPTGLATPNYQEPMKGDLLWVYEGMTNYLGEILAARSGIWQPEDYRSRIADHAAEIDNRPGASWRSLQDTAISAQLLYGSSSEWQAWRRSTDFYPEGSLLWLEVDTIIRTKSRGKKSLDDFCRAFEGGKSGPPAMIPYTFDELVAALNQILPYDWREFFQTRLNSLSPRAPLAGIENAGWRLIYTETPSDMDKANEEKHDQIDASYSLGLLVKGNGKVMDVLPGTPAYSAGLAPGMKIVSVNNREFSSQALHETLRQSTTTSTALELLVSSDERISTLHVDYHGGEKYPHLQRDASKADMLRDILAPLSSPQ
jgi:predicted metalloprotease with PDZ domain